MLILMKCNRNLQCSIIAKIVEIIVNQVRIIVKLGQIIAIGRKRGLAKFDISQNQEDNSQPSKDNSQTWEHNSQRKKKGLSEIPY